MFWPRHRGGKFLFGTKPFGLAPILQHQDYANPCMSGHPFHVA